MHFKCAVLIVKMSISNLFKNNIYKYIKFIQNFHSSFPHFVYLGLCEKKGVGAQESVSPNCCVFLPAEQLDANGKALSGIFFIGFEIRLRKEL